LSKSNTAEKSQLEIVSVGSGAGIDGGGGDYVGKPVIETVRQ
jgi:hypothetical protein